MKLDGWGDYHLKQKGPRVLFALIMIVLLTLAFIYGTGWESTTARVISTSIGAVIMVITGYVEFYGRWRSINKKE